MKLQIKRWGELGAGWKYFIIFCFAIGFFTLVFGVCGKKAEAASAELSWDVPSQNCDGSELTDLDRYVIRWGDTQGGPYPDVSVVSNPADTTTVVDVGDQDDTTLYFIMVSVDTAGNYSDGPGGCGTSNEVAVPFAPIFPSHPTNLLGVQVQ